jgi:hypothetical protein
VYDGLGQVSTHFEGSNVFVSFTEIMAIVELEKLSFARKNAAYLLGEDAISALFVVEELASFGGIVDNFGDLNGS